MEDRDYLRHIRRAIREIQEHTAGLTLDGYERDSETQRAVERNLARTLTSSGSKSTRRGT